MDTATTTTRRATPWNKGKLLGQKHPLKLKEIWAIRKRQPEAALTVSQSLRSRKAVLMLSGRKAAGSKAPPHHSSISVCSSWAGFRIASRKSA